jgi:toxin ParE1/3/4
VVRYSRRAKADIRHIWGYTVDNWGQGQAEIYLGLIDAALDSIVSDPKLGRPLSGMRRSYRKYLVGSHAVFYRLSGRTILIVRILHQRMDPERHF